MNIQWELETDAAYGFDAHGDWHIASDHLLCKCSVEDHRPEVEEQFAISFRTGRMVSYAEASAWTPEHHDETITPERWRESQAANEAALSSAVIEGDAYAEIWSTTDDQVPHRLRFAVNACLRSVAAELGIQEPNIFWFTRGPGARSLNAFCRHSANEVHIWSGLDPALGEEAVAHECRHLSDGPDGDEADAREFGRAYCESRFDPNAAAIAAAYAR